MDVVGDFNAAREEEYEEFAQNCESFWAELDRTEAGGEYSFSELEEGSAEIAKLAASVGMLALGWIPDSFALMVSSLFVYSSGQHVYMPLANSIGMGFAQKGREGSVLGKLSSISTIALLVGTAILFRMNFQAD